MDGTSYELLADIVESFGFIFSPKGQPLDSQQEMSCWVKANVGILNFKVNKPPRSGFVERTSNKNVLVAFDF